MRAEQIAGACLNHHEKTNVDAIRTRMNALTEHVIPKKGKDLTALRRAVVLKLRKCGVKI